MKREQNEDNYILLDDVRLCVVADGMGGYEAGEIASQMAIDTMSEFFNSTEKDPERTWPYKMDKARGYDENRLITGVKLANLRIFQSWQAKSSGKQAGTMGTTIVALHAVPEGMLIGHVGDSRAYRVRDGAIQQLTEDHSLLNDFLKMRRMTKEEVPNFPFKNIIVRALGMKDSVKVDTMLDTPKPGDVYLLCSDGLCGVVPDEDICDTIAKAADLHAACARLCEQANEHGGPDNITAVLCKWLGSN